MEPFAQFSLLKSSADFRNCASYENVATVRNISGFVLQPLVANITCRSKNPVSVGGALENQDLADEQRGLLDLTDQIQFAQLHNVKLPQIVVVGDQSGGKSSVLEAITGTPFPRHADGCTRFTTEIRLRRAAEEKLTIRIIPDLKIRTYEEQKRLQRFGVTVDEFTNFSTLMMQAVD